MTDAPDVRKIQWKLLSDALGYLRHAEFEVGRGDPGAGEMWLGDIRRCLGELALTLADDPDAVGYAKLLENVLTEPSVTRTARVALDASAWENFLKRGDR